MPTAPDRARRLAALAGAFTGALLVASLALAGFSSSSTATQTVRTKRIFLGSRTAGAHGLIDASSGTGATKDDTVAFADGIVDATGNWNNAFASNRYLRFDLSAQMPAGVPVSGATFDFRMIPNAGGDSACYYLEVHRISDNSLLGTHFSSGSPQCVTGTTYTTISTPLPEVTTSDVANDMYVKVFGYESTKRPMKVDTATVTLTLYGQTETLYPRAYTDASTGTATNGAFLGLEVAGDGVTYTNTNNWPTAYAATKYLQLAFPATIPAGAVVTGVTFDRTWKSNGTQTLCYYIDVYSGASLIGTHGSGSQISCDTNTAYVTDHTALPEVASATAANQLYIRVYEKASAGQKSLDDLDTITVTYHLD